MTAKYENGKLTITVEMENILLDLERLTNEFKITSPDEFGKYMETHVLSFVQLNPIILEEDTPIFTQLIDTCISEAAELGDRGVLWIDVFAESDL